MHESISPKAQPSAGPMTACAVGCLLLVAMLGGCVSQPTGPAPEQMSDLRAQIEQLEAELALVRQGLADRNDHQAAAWETMEARLASLQAQIDALPDELAILLPAPDHEAPADSTAAAPTPAPEAARSPEGQEKLVVGEMERVWLEPPGVSIVAKIDPTVEASTLSAQDVMTFERDGRKWVRFNLVGENGVVAMERPLRRNVRVTEGGSGRRPAVTVRVHLGGVREAVEVALVDLSERDYSIVLGRNFLTDLAVLDVGQKFLQPASQTR
jgi:hypothetical protein